MAAEALSSRAVQTELIMTGIGGQGVQVATKILGRAAAARGLHVMMFGMFGGSVRGGRSEMTLVVSDEPIEEPPILASTGSAVALHGEFAGPVLIRVRAGGLVIANTPLVSIERTDVEIVAVPMTEIAEELGSVALVSMVALGAYVAATRIVPIDAALDAMRASIPAYRASRIPANEAAIARGAASVGVRA